MECKNACAHEWVKGTAAFQIAEDERKKCLEYRASVDLSNMKESIERIWRLVGTFKDGSLTFATSRRSWTSAWRR
jgi:hypothetical protein